MTDKPPMGFFKSCLLFCIAFLLLVTTTPLGFVYAFFRQLFFSKLKSLSIYFVEVAIALDITGNVTMQFLLNDLLLINNKDSYYFGNSKETISSVIGKNSITGTLSFLGRALNRFLNFIDTNHSLNSIIYDVKRWKEGN